MIAMTLVLWRTTSHSFALTGWGWLFAAWVIPSAVGFPIVLKVKK